MVERNKRLHISITEERFNWLEDWAEQQGRPVANLAAHLTEKAILQAKQSGEYVPTVKSASGDLPVDEQLELFRGFLKCLTETYDHDGYSIAEMSALMGFKDDKKLLAMIQKLQSNGTSKIGQENRK